MIKYIIYKRIFYFVSATTLFVFKKIAINYLAIVILSRRIVISRILSRYYDVELRVRITIIVERQKEYSQVVCVYFVSRVRKQTRPDEAQLCK